MIFIVSKEGLYPQKHFLWKAFLEHNAGKTMIATFEEYSEKGGLGYDRFYFGTLIPTLGIKYWAECWGKNYDKDDCHYWFKMLFHSKQRINPRTGEPVTTVKEYSKLTNKGKEAYITEVRNHIHEKTGDFMNCPWEI